MGRITAGSQRTRRYPLGHIELERHVQRAHRLQVTATRDADSKDHVWDVEDGILVRTGAP